MCLSNISILLSLTVALTGTLATICPVPPPCRCTTFSGARAYCNNLNLTEIPKLVRSGGTWTLDLSNNNLTTVQAGAFSIIQLEQLYLSNNSIDYVDNDAFLGSEKTMDVVRLDGNRLVSLPAALTHLHNIIGINIQYNPMVDIDEEILRNLSKSLIAISFGSEHLTVWPKSLQRLQQLLMLTVYGLRLTNFPNTAFEGFEKSLNFLEVIGTSFTNLPVQMNQLINLNYISLKENHFLTEVPEEAFRGLKNISTIILQNNGLTNLPAVFKDSDKMYQTFISSESITNVIDSSYPATTQPKFSYLTITNTNLQNIPSAIGNIPTLTVISLQNGKISIVRSTDFQNLPALANIVLTSNPLTVIDHDAFRNLPSLRYLYLDGSMLNTIPEAVQNTKVSLINLNNTKIHCACSNLQWMKTWPLRLNTTIEGNCFNIKMTLEEFKTRIIPTC